MSSSAATLDALIGRVGDIATLFTIELPDGEKRTLGQGKPEFHVGPDSRTVILRLAFPWWCVIGRA